MKTDRAGKVARPNAFAVSYALVRDTGGPVGRPVRVAGCADAYRNLVVDLHRAAGAAWGFAMLVVVRFLFGAGEAGALPNAARVVREWFPDSSRARAKGLVAASMLLGGAAAPRPRNGS